jgi:hypothetical protein
VTSEDFVSLVTPLAARGWPKSSSHLLDQSSHYFFDVVHHYHLFGYWFALRSILNTSTLFSLKVITECFTKDKQIE